MKIQVTFQYTQLEKVNEEKDQNGRRAYSVLLLGKRKLYYGGELHNDVVFIGT